MFSYLIGIVFDQFLEKIILDLSGKIRQIQNPIGIQFGSRYQTISSPNTRAYTIPEFHYQHQNNSFFMPYFEEYTCFSIKHLFHRNNRCQHFKTLNAVKTQADV